MKKIRFGVLSTANIGLKKVIPALQQCQHAEVVAIASRRLSVAESAAKELGIRKAYGSYEELLADPDVDAIYNPLPNHLHVQWSKQAATAGKHVLCEKPIGLSVEEAQDLLDFSAANSDIKIMEAFMYRFHPQWLKAKSLVDDGSIGELLTVQSFFSYMNTDGNNIRNQADKGGGGLMDIGCYNISLSRFIFGDEPKRVMCSLDLDPTFNTDRFASGMLEFSAGMATFTCSTQLSSYQRVNILGSKGRIEIEVPFNAPNDEKCRLWIDRSGVIEEISFDEVDQYTLQGDAFAKSILNNEPVPTPLLDAVANMQVIERLVKSAKSQSWE